MGMDTSVSESELISLWEALKSSNELRYYAFILFLKQGLTSLKVTKLQVFCQYFLCTST